MFAKESLLKANADAAKRFRTVFRDTENAFRILGGDFVSADDGTGIVHMAPGFGEDDLAACHAAGIPVVVSVDEASQRAEADFASLPTCRSRTLARRTRQVRRLAVTSKTWRGCLARCGAGACFGTGGDRKRIGGHGHGYRRSKSKPPAPARESR